MQNTETTVVVYRRYAKKQGGGVIALFPYDVGTREPRTMNSYQRIGQHGAAAQDIVYKTKLARLSEPDVDALHRELTSIGYDLIVRSRIGHDAYEARCKQLGRR